MRALLVIPARLTPLVADALMTSYAAKAETLHKAIVGEPGAGQFPPTRAHRDALLEIDELLDQLDFSPACRPVEIAGERDVLATAVHDALTNTIALLAAECDDYWRGAAGLDDIATAANTVRKLLRLLRHRDRRHRPTPTTLKTQRDTIETEITTERAAVEQKLADRITALSELNAVIRAIERQQGAGATNGTRTPRGHNRDKILAVIANGTRSTTEISKATGIGRGSADRTLKQLALDGAARKPDNGWTVT